MTTFNLPDLGEGLPEAEIVNWHVKVGDRVNVDQPMVVGGDRQGGGRSAVALHRGDHGTACQEWRRGQYRSAAG